MSPSVSANRRRREPLPEVGPQQVAERVDRHHRRQAHRHRRRCVGRGRRRLRRRAHVAAQHRARVAARGEQRIPLAGVDARHPEPGRILRERHRVAALGGEPLHLGRGFVHVEERQDPARDEAIGIRAAPLVDVPVVVGLDHHEVDVAVGPGVEHLAGEAGQVREVQARELAAGRHVAHALVHVVATGPHVLVAHRIDVEHLRCLARDRVQAEVPAAQVAVVPLERAAGFLHDARRLIAVARRDVCGEHVGRFADVVVDRDQDEIVGVHRAAAL